MMTNDKDRIQNAIRHIKTSVDIDPWAMEIAVEAMEKQIPKKYIRDGIIGRCPFCGSTYVPVLSNQGNNTYCCRCGQRIDCPCFEEK